MSLSGVSYTVYVLQILYLSNVIRIYWLFTCWNCIPNLALHLRLCLLYNIYNWCTMLCNHHCTRLLEADPWGIYLELYLYVLYCDLPSAFPPSSSHSIFVSTNFFYMDIIINYINNKSSIIQPNKYKYFNQAKR